MRITLKQLKRRRACSDQVALFEHMFGAGVEVTQANCLKGAAAGLDFGWAAAHLLDAPAYAAYDEAIASARAAYREAMAVEFYEAAQLMEERI